ncbi:hypothetical protein, partial [Micromonospora sp. ATA51]|uniref:hypothetical protein n=1 Tax=Micromonospora sp. ATA51 TaxID=2806098 RepID=UPI001EE41760
MPPTATRPLIRRRLTVPVTLLALLPLAGCGTPPELRRRPSRQPPLRPPRAPPPPPRPPRP